MGLGDITGVPKEVIKELPIKQVAENTLDKPTAELGHGLESLIWLIFSPIHAAKASLEPRINAFKKRLEHELSMIPKEKLVEPPLNIVGPTLEAAKYHIEHEEIRDLFVKLITSSMDANLQSSVHPSFVEVIKQFSPLDAIMLKYLIDNKHVPIASICSFENSPKQRYAQARFDMFEDIVPFPDMNLENCHVYIASIQNLRRLSIISTDYEASYSDDRYESLYKHKIMEEVIEEYGNVQKFPVMENRTIDLKRGTWLFTMFGKMFIECCIGERTSQ